VTTITTQDYDGNTVSQEVSHTVTIKNPCIDPDFVYIQLPNALANLEYTIDSGAVSYAPIATGTAA